jgi:hypothetical protein
MVERYCQQEILRVQRGQCPRCGKTFRLLPDFLVPYKQYGAETIEKALLAYAVKKSYHGVAKQMGLAVMLIKHWVRWWQRVVAVMEAVGVMTIRLGAGGLGQLLAGFPRWTGSGCCWP